MPPKQAPMDGFHWADLLSFLLPKSTRFIVSVREEGTILIDAGSSASAPKASGDGKVITAPVAGTVFKLPLSENSEVASGDTVIILESMKMELEVKTGDAGKVRYLTKEGTSVAVGDPLVEIV